MWRDSLARRMWVICSLLVIVHVGCKRTTQSQTPTIDYQVIGTIPHRSDAFTQGLAIDNGQLYEGTGLYGRSTVSRLDLNTGRVIQSIHLAEGFFGEGVTVLCGRVYQLTWRQEVVFVYDANSLDLLRQVPYPHEAWGLTNDGRMLILSDGTETLYWLDPNTMQVAKTIRVFDHHGPVKALNELEMIGSRILANIWQTGRIAVIDQDTGKVLVYIDITDLWRARLGSADVPNGIAYNKAADELLVTGKLWQWIYRIRVDWKKVPKDY